MSIAAIGEPLFLARHRGLLDGLADDRTDVRTVPLDGYLAPGVPGQVLRYAHLSARHLGASGPLDYLAQKNAVAFRLRSRRAARAVAAAPGVDAVLQIFSQFCTDTAVQVPRFMFVDYTTRLAEVNWPQWAWFPTKGERSRWLGLERRAYRTAAHVFVMGESVRRSLVEHYGVASAAITVVGSAPSVVGRFERRSPRPGMLLMNASDFRRKGGDVAVAAFRLIRQVRPGARLVIVGNRRPVSAEGVDDLGVVDAGRMRALLTRADLVLAPARCDPFPTFLVEAQQCGVPAVISARDGMPEIVVDGETGRVVPTLDPAVLAGTVLGLLADRTELERLSRAAHARATAHFSWPHIAARARSVIDTTIGRMEQ